jgi:tRNA 2-thiouridine synthesizing protein B
MILHTVATTPHQAAFEDCLAILSPEDAVLLLGDGVYAGIEHTEAFERLQGTGATIHILREDALAAGLMERLAPAAVIDMDGFVALTERYPRQIGWY